MNQVRPLRLLHLPANREPPTLSDAIIEKQSITRLKCNIVIRVVCKKNTSINHINTDYKTLFIAFSAIEISTAATTDAAKIAKGKTTLSKPKAKASFTSSFIAEFCTLELRDRSS